MTQYPVVSVPFSSLFLVLCPPLLSFTLQNGLFGIKGTRIPYYLILNLPKVHLDLGK
jgi:hypothetical protein